MDQGPLVSTQIEAGKRLAAEFDKSLPLRIAFWLKGSEDGEWYLYLASDQITSANFGDAYETVARIVFQGEPAPWLDPFQVKVAGTDHPIVRDILSEQQKYGKYATRLRDRLLGGSLVSDVYVYPLPAATVS